MLSIIVSFLCGLVFGLGLLVSQMSNPAKVLNFLDIAAIGSGQWDASLAFVMLGAIPVAALGFVLARHRRKPVLGGEFHWPDLLAHKAWPLDVRLVGGAALFGVGWGLVGFCPGPAITALGFGRAEAWIFFIAIAAGMLLFNVIDSRLQNALQSDADEAQASEPSPSV